MRYESTQILFDRLSEIDGNRRIANHFNRSIHTHVSTGLGALYIDGVLSIDTPSTRHGVYLYRGAMRHEVFSVTKRMAGALSMFYFAERYGEQVFEELRTDYVPASASLPEWQGVTRAHALNMVTGTRAGESGDLLYHHAAVDSASPMQYCSEEITMSVYVDRTLKFTFDDLMKIPEDDPYRHEIYDGTHVASPPPGVNHQYVSKRMQHQLYTKIELAGVPEYWIIDHEAKQVEVYRYHRTTGSYGEPEVATGTLDYQFEGTSIRIDLSEVF